MNIPSNCALPAAPTQRIVLHADDFGMNSAVNAGIVRAFDEGLLTSASLLANAPATGEALTQAAWLADRRSAGTLASRGRRTELADPAVAFDFGVHVNLTQGCPLTASFPAALLTGDGRFLNIGALYGRLFVSPRRWQRAIADELAAQVALVCDHGLRPTHLNGHQYIELLPVVAGQLPTLLARFAIPVIRVAREPGLWASTRLGRAGMAGRMLAGVKHWYAGRFGRRMKSAGLAFADRFFGTAHAGRIEQQVLGSFLNSAAGCCLSEIALHPGGSPATQIRAATGWADPLEDRRPQELALLTSPLLATLLAAGGFSLGRLSTLAVRGASRERAA
ncbi:MAG TPA: ChbG/HpnK family deacetylase [Pirellulales bacterium]|nr:ChbG/HpnK family deacetylase [Pirellulales bacterium]